MLDAHPKLAIPPETVFNEVFRLAQSSLPVTDLPQTVLAAMSSSQRWNDLHVSVTTMRDEFASMGDAFSISDGLRIFYRLYAAGQGKARYGDKTPGHMFWLPQIATLLPEAVFIHIIRDGRDVAASMRRLWFGPGNDMKAQAESWLKWLNAGFAAASSYPGRYLEVRYEELVANPEPVLRRVLSFIDLPFDATALRYHERASERIAELGELLQGDGRLYATRETHQGIHARTLEPPNERQVGRYRQDLSPSEIADFESVAGPLLRKLGYIQ